MKAKKIPKKELERRKSQSSNSNKYAKIYKMQKSDQLFHLPGNLKDWIVDIKIP